MTDPTARCVIGTREHQAHDGYLCENHLQRLSRTLREIEDEAVQLEAAPSMALRFDQSGGGLASEQAPGRLNVLAFRDGRTRRWEPWTDDDRPAYQRLAPKSIGPWCLLCDHDTCSAWRAGRRRDLHDDEMDSGSAELASVLAELHNWARLVREERGLASPERVTVTGERDTLTRHLLWCADQPWIDEMYADLTKLLRQLKRVNGTTEIAAGICGSLQADGLLCDGKVWHIMIKHDGEPDEPGFRCGTCRRVWTGTEAVRKRDDMWRDEQQRKATA
ncbi:MAG: hypothetical protein JWO67_2223 [Streptosporangiaceae bacterium]|nr:hypothetical protein [Streptosporangiaceae bacterium]